MILEEWIIVHIRPTMRQRFQELGYICDIPIHGKRCTYEIICHIHDLPVKSHTLVTRICDECGKVDAVVYQNGRLSICDKCSRKYRHDYQYKCSDCGKLLMRTNTKNPPRCKKCYSKYVKQERGEMLKMNISKSERLESFWKQLGELK